MIVTPLEQDLCCQLRDLPRQFGNRYGDLARNTLLQTLFTSLAGRNPEYLPYFFPNGVPDPNTPWSMSLAQGAVQGAEYTAAARGHPCGHIFKANESTYRCVTCGVDDTCVLCAKCFYGSDHEGHSIKVGLSSGNSGCCDCGDKEAWRRPVNCSIHTLDEEGQHSAEKGKGTISTDLPTDLVNSVRTTVARALDYLCDVISCSPEQLRQPKTEDSVREDEQLSRLSEKWYGARDDDEADDEFALILWNDEKHTVDDVRDQVARACKEKKSFGYEKAMEVNDFGRSVVKYTKDLKALLKMAKIIEEIKITVTIRSARDTFREQMCGTIIEWISDIAGCAVGADNHILRNVITEEMLNKWRIGSEGLHQDVGKDGIYDHEVEEMEYETLRHEGRTFANLVNRRRRQQRTTTNMVAEWFQVRRREPAQGNTDEDEDDSDEDEYDQYDTDPYDEGDEMDVDEAEAADTPEQQAMDVDADNVDELEDITETSEATIAGYPRPPPPPPAARRRDNDQSPVDSDEAEQPYPIMTIPRTPTAKPRPLRPPRTPKYWLEKPEGYRNKQALPIYEDLHQRVRLDFMILYDLRLWKKARSDLRYVYISTIVTIPKFKRVLGLRFAGLYTMLSQLFLIADREPEHSIITMSLQMLTTPSITAEVVERGNFFTTLMAILYTFLTTRQVGYPKDVNPQATLAFDAGALTNRRISNLFNDMRYMFSSEHVQRVLREEDRYLKQFLDLVKLHQGICPNERAVGEHVEYETDAWIGASIITSQMNKLCRALAEAFEWNHDQDHYALFRAIRRSAGTAIINSLGCERKRFAQAEIKNPVAFKKLEKFEFDADDWRHSSNIKYTVVDAVVEKIPMSFHHPLHYTLSWLIDCGKSMSREDILGLLTFTDTQLKEMVNTSRIRVPDYQAEEYLLALFDFPLRTCAWLAQMRADMWVRNGITLKHQMSTYRGVLQRDVGYQRDVFMIQTAAVLLSPGSFLASIVDRFGMADGITGKYEVKDGWDETQTLGVWEDFIHLLIIVLCNRTFLVPIEEEPNPYEYTVRHDLIQALCFKPLSFSEIKTRLTESVTNLEFQEILEDMATFKAPEGISDSGAFELKQEHIPSVDPYSAHFTRNQREESEQVYKRYMAKKTGKPIEDIVFDPKLREIKTGLFSDLSAFTRIPLFAQIIYYTLGMGLHTSLRGELDSRKRLTPRVESLLHFALHLMIIAMKEDHSQEELMTDEPKHNFSDLILAHRTKVVGHPTIFHILQSLSGIEDYKSCQPKIRFVLRNLQHKRPRGFAAAVTQMGLPMDRLDTGSPATDEERELKKKQALARQAKVMAQFKTQQNTFLQNQNFDWGEDLSDMEDDFQEASEHIQKMFHYPTGACILCQEETNDQSLYGTFGYLSESRILRQTDLKDEDFVAEVFNTPSSLDRSADHLRPFGVASQNRRKVIKTTTDGKHIISERQELGKGFPTACHRQGPVSVGCGHIMHWSCFEQYMVATQRRHYQQIARNHPERINLQEFICPLCKALGNAFFPIIWKSKPVTYPGVLETEAPFEDWLSSHLPLRISRLDKSVVSAFAPLSQPLRGFFESSLDNVNSQLLPKLHELSGIDTSALQEQHASSSIVSSGPFATVAPFLGLDPTRDPRTIFEAATPSINPPLAPESQALILMKIYQRLATTIAINDLNSEWMNHYARPSAGAPPNLTYIDTMMRSLGYSISSVEISQRGVESEPGSTLLDKISPQSLTHLRILSETISAYIAAGGLQGQKDTDTVKEFTEHRNRQLFQLLTGHGQIYEARPGRYTQKESLLDTDIFVYLAEASLCCIPAVGLDIHHVLRMCYLAEIVKVVVAFLHDPEAAWQLAPKAGAGQQFLDFMNDSSISATGEQAALFSDFIRRIADECNDSAGITESESRIQPSNFSGDESVFHLFLRRLVASYALPFLRKAAILMHVRYDVDFPSSGLSDIDESELQRLTRLLRLPSLDEMFETYTTQTMIGSITRSIVGGWIRHWTWRSSRRPISLSHPAIFELVGLPKNYDTLMDEAMRWRCPTTNKEITDACVCLFCGDIFCGQATCCFKERKIGGCNQHADRCGGATGLFINLKKCMVILLNKRNGSYINAPYLDKHGEVDPTLRKGYQLFLHQKRYDLVVRNMWLQHQIPSTIARRLEGDINNGGWETL